MLIIPIYEKTDWKHLPFISLLLIVVNILVYNFVQNDNTSIRQAANYYFSSNLNQHEYPRYFEYLKKNQPRLANELKQYQLPQRQYLIFRNLILDKSFNQALDAGKIITSADIDYTAWHLKRTRYKELYQSISSLHYGIRPAYNSLTTAFSYMFLHGSMGHLIGNMIFLLILGFALEKALGKLLFSIAYLGSGVLAAEFFAMGNSSVVTPTIGASGAISGLMAIFTVIFGLRKINFFYWVVFYFDYIRAPAIAVLPIWIGHEIYQATSNASSNINYLIHLGGLVAGIIIATAYRISQVKINTEFIDQQNNEQRSRVSLDQAMQAIAKLNYTKAAKIFRRLIKENPHDPEILRHYHTVLTQLPVNNSYHKVTLQLLSMPIADAKQAQVALQRYNHYLNRVANDNQLELQHTLSLAKAFARFGLTHEAEKIVTVICQHRPDNENIPELLLLLANSFNRLNNDERQMHYLTMLIKKHPDTNEALIATNYLSEQPVQQYRVH